MRIYSGIALGCLLMSSSLFGQKLELNLGQLKAKAKAANEVSLDGAALDAAVKMGLEATQKGAADNKGGGEQVRKLLAGVKGIYVRNYEFAKEGAYTDADVDSIVSQVQGKPDWSQIVSVKEEKERTEIYLMSHGDQVEGLLILSAEPAELTLVNVVGSVTAADAKELVDSRILGYMMSGAAAGAAKDESKGK